MKEKKPLTQKQLKNKYLLNSKLLYAAKPVATATPLAITMGVKANEWFGTDWKVATGGTIAIIIMGIASLLVNKKTEDKTITNSWISLIIGWFAVAFIFMLLSQIAQEIWWIMLVAGSGMLAGAGIDYLEKDQLNKANKIKVAYDEAEKEMMKESIKEEIKKQATE